MSRRDETSPGAQQVPAPTPATRLTAWLGAAAIVLSVVIMVVIAASGPNVSVPVVPGSLSPSWWHLSGGTTVVLLWTAMGLGCAGVLAALAAVAKGARLPVYPILGFAFLAVVVLTILPPAGSTDSLSYAASGRIAVLGHNPYVMTPFQLEHSGDPIGRQIHAIPAQWNNSPSVYGPIATAAEWVAAKLGGTSLGHIAFWLKLLEAVCFVVVALVLDRVLRRDPAMRLRAHLLWTANPVLLWEIVAGGHIDGLAAMFGLLAVLALRKDARRNLSAMGAFVSGLVVALAAGVKVEYALFGLAVAWACRRSIPALAAAAAGFAVVTIPAYALAGTSAVKVLFNRSNGITSDTMYQLFWRPVLGYAHFSASQVPPHLVTVSYLLFAAVAVLAMLRLPDRTPDLPALAPALGLSLAWLFVTPFQRPWYDVMAISLLALTCSLGKGASLLDWVVLIRLLAGALAYTIAVDVTPRDLPSWLYSLYFTADADWITPAIFLLATIALVWMCIKGYPQAKAVDSTESNASGTKLPLAT
ncbi:MAG TPA: glycosyltransferase 87 family protein [Streptosporangiaceae bacterium]